MAKKIEQPLVLAKDAAAQLQECYGEDCRAIVVFGSAAGGDFDPLKSDINLLVVLKDMSIESVSQSADLQARLARQRFAPPLFMDNDYIEGSLDTFPIEFLNMKSCYHLLCGEDPFAHITISPRDLRLQIERELKGKRLHLLQEWLPARRHKHLLQKLIMVSLADFLPLFRAMLYLKKQDVPSNRREVLEAVETAFGLEKTPLQAVLAAAGEQNLEKMVQAFGDYAAVVRTLITHIDTFSEE